MVEMESDIGKETRQRKQRIAKRRAKTAGKGLSTEKMDVEIEKKSQSSEGKMQDNAATITVE